jgi:hypothetical protein
MRAVLWILAQQATFRQDNYQETTLLEYINHIRMGKEKLYQQPKRRRLVADYLMVLDVQWQRTVMSVNFLAWFHDLLK